MNNFINGWKGYTLLGLFALTFGLLALLPDELPPTVRIIIVSVFTLISIAVFIHARILKLLDVEINGYTIKKGKHRSFYGLNRVGNTLEFMFTFTKEHRYLHLNPSDHYNKLLGITSLFIHKNSARLAWRQLPTGKFQVAAYNYIKGERLITPMMELNENEPMHCVIELRDGHSVFTIHGRYHDSEVVVIFPRSKKYGWLTYPYFGGVPKAPKEFNFVFK